MKRDLVCKPLWVIVSLKLKSTRNFPLRISMQSKNNNNGKMQMTVILLFCAKVKQISDICKHFLRKNAQEIEN